MAQTLRCNEEKIVDKGTEFASEFQTWCQHLGSLPAKKCFRIAPDRDAEKLALTDQLLDAALGELGVAAREQPCLTVGDFNVEPTKIPCLAKGISAGLWVDLEAAWACASGRLPGVTCKRT